MAEQTEPTLNMPDPTEWSRTMASVAERSQKLITEFMSRQTAQGPNFGMADPLNIGQAFLDMTARLMSDPARLVEAQVNLWQDYMALWQTTALRMMGQEVEPVVEPGKDDRRFRDDAWRENEVFDFIKQSYLLSARWVQGLVKDVEGLGEKETKKIDFYTRQFVDALAPSNFIATNPEVLRATLESGGENLLKGLDNLLSDLERGKGNLQISMTDTEAFHVGENIAVSPGKVVYQNDLMQLIQYSPATEQQHKRPLLIIPPWINKFYILDLRPKNSLVKWAVEQGHTLFMVSWVNPDERLAAKTFEDYMLEGPLDAIKQIEAQTGESSVNAIGYCLGGTLLASTLAYLHATGAQDKVASATFFVTMTDFEEPGELGVFIDEEQLATLEARISERGYLEGAEMSTTFNMLRANDLIWSFVVNNYLLGKDPFPFDLLYWNSDSTRMPAAMHSFYLRKMYQQNLLCEPGGVTMAGVPIDLSTIKTPSYFISTIDDHIAPWKSTFAGSQRFGGPVKFVLSGSGHIAGIVNPPAAGKYCHWINNRKVKNADTWLSGATKNDGSWWPDWEKWVEKFADGQVPARDPAAGPLAVLEDAPGSYVKVRATAD